MAVNKNFVVKNGLEVYTDLLFADSATHSVGVGSTSPNFDLDVRGGIGATDLRVTGFTTLTKDFQVGASGSAFYVSNTNNLVGVGTSVPAFLMDIRSSVSTGQTALYVKGDMRVTGDINLDDLTIDDLTVTGIATYKPDGSGGSPDSWIDIDYTGNTTTGGGTTVGFGSTAYFVDEAKVVFGAGEDLTIGHVGGLNVIGGAVKFNDTTQSSSKDTGSVILEGGAGIEKNLFVGGGAEITGLTTITGVLDANDTTQSSSSTTGAAKFAGGVGVAKNLFVGGGAEVTGVTTITGTLDANGALDVDGHTELDDVNVAGAATFAGAIDANSTSDFNGVVTVSNTTQSSSKDTGAIIVEGGAGIEKNLFVGGGAEVTGVTTITGTLDANGALDVDGHTELDDVNVAGASTFTGAIDANGGADISGGSGLVADTARVADLTDNRVVIAGAGGELEDSADLTFDGTTLAIDAIIDSNDATQSSSSTTGSLQVAGGAGIAKNLFVGGGAHVGAAFTINSGIGVTIILDEDDMASNSASALASQQSIKAYVDTQITAEDLDFAGDSGTGAVDLDSQSLTISGTASEIKTVASGQSLTISLPDDVIVGNGFTVTGIGSFLNDVNFRGKSGLTSAYWDKSESSLTFKDNAKAEFGDSNDLQIFHDGSHSQIQDTGTGNLYIVGHSNVSIDKYTGEEMANFNVDGSVQLYFNDVERFKTGPAGTIVTGVSTADGFSVGDFEYITAGIGSDLALYHDTSNSWIKNTTNTLILASDLLELKNEAGTETYVKGTNNGSTEIYWDNTKKFETSGVGATVHGTGALNIPVGTTAERPTLGNSPVNGDIRYNTTLNSYEGYGNGAWGGLGGGTEIDNTIATTTATGISTFVKTDYRSAYFRLQITQGSAYQVGRYLLIHDGTTATLIEESAIATGSMLGSVTAAVVSSNVIISINMSSANSATITHIIDKITV